MIVIRIADINVGIENRYDLSTRMGYWGTDATPDLTVSVSQEELEAEDAGRGLSPEYLEFICTYRHIAELLPDYDAFVFHCAAVNVDDRAYLFTAPSGTGKTTHALKWVRTFRDASIFSGDKPILRRTPEGFIACGTPWRGKEAIGSRQQLPVQGVCVLQRGTTDSIVPLTPAEAVPFLFHQVYMPEDPGRMEKMLALLDDFCRATPLWAMRCTLDPRSPYVSREAMQPKP